MRSAQAYPSSLPQLLVAFIENMQDVVKYKLSDTGASPFASA